MAEMTNTTKVQMQTAPKQNDFPTETIELPSQGLVYPEGHPLKKGTCEIKYMTAREEDILASQNLIKKGIVLDKLFESVVVEPGVNPGILFVVATGTVGIGTVVSTSEASGLPIVDTVVFGAFTTFTDSAYSGSVISMMTARLEKTFVTLPTRPAAFSTGIPTLMPLSLP
jgi:hypothetical protein